MGIHWLQPKTATLAGGLVLAAAAVWLFAFSSTLKQIEQRAEADLRLSANRLSDRLGRFAELAVLLSDHPEISKSVLGSPSESLSRLLQNTADKTRADMISIYDRSGRLVSTSDPTRRGEEIAARQDFERALDGALGQRHWFDEVNDRRVFSYAHPVFSPDGPVAGVVVVDVDVETIEADWRGDATAVYFAGVDNVVFLSNRSELILRDASSFKHRLALNWPPWNPDANSRLWIVDEGKYVPSRALRVSAYLPRNDLTGVVLVDFGLAFRNAWLWTLVYAGLVAAILAGMRAEKSRRDALSARLEAEEEATRTLERRVQERTTDLSQANSELRHEISERKEAQEALQRAQADLVQAGKLSALGQMSAGISHELNQPIMAIESLAENGNTFLERGNMGAVERNLSQMGSLARRMGRIVQNLRAFARQEKIPLGEVDLTAAVNAALDLADASLRVGEVAVDWTPPMPRVLVRAGEVRLSQVVLNLITNAIDAMEGQDKRALSLYVERGSQAVVLVVRDTGPGLREPERIFDPFFTTKEVGKSDGMGLGLSISYGLVQSFGGEIQGRNHPEGGAEFRVLLPVSRVEEAA